MLKEAAIVVVAVSSLFLYGLLPIVGSGLLAVVVWVALKGVYVVLKGLAFVAERIVVYQKRAVQAVVPLVTVAAGVLSEL